ncbi:MAG: hypothetical protein LC118_08060 [Dehalococcoidia bacterium]|nr:hypothetical protein [Dehalococcoidia bacterium]
MREVVGGRPLLHRLQAVVAGDDAVLDLRPLGAEGVQLRLDLLGLGLSGQSLLALLRELRDAVVDLLEGLALHLDELPLRRGLGDPLPVRHHRRALRLVARAVHLVELLVRLLEVGLRPGEALRLRLHVPELCGEALLALGPAREAVAVLARQARVRPLCPADAPGALDVEVGGVNDEPPPLRLQQLLRVWEVVRLVVPGEAREHPGVGRLPRVLPDLGDVLDGACPRDHRLRLEACPQEREVVLLDRLLHDLGLLQCLGVDVHL